MERPRRRRRLRRHWLLRRDVRGFAAAADACSLPAVPVRAAPRAYANTPSSPLLVPAGMGRRGGASAGDPCELLGLGRLHPPCVLATASVHRAGSRNTARHHRPQGRCVRRRGAGGNSLTPSRRVCNTILPTDRECEAKTHEHRMTGHSEDLQVTSQTQRHRLAKNCFYDETFPFIPFTPGGSYLIPAQTVGAQSLPSHFQI